MTVPALELSSINYVYL
uniref:Uncharacterized protein n=1 Tax=Arundo donax TaxID=35708 RepID=A0A0A9CA24_ARUDO